MVSIKILGLFAVVVSVFGAEDYTYQSGRQIDIGIGFKNSKSKYNKKI